jgi:hypothetical protein
MYRLFEAHMKKFTARQLGRVSRRNHLTLKPCEYKCRPGCRAAWHSLEMPKRSVWDGTYIAEVNRCLG